MCARFTVLSDTPIAAAIAGWAIPLSRNNTIWMRWRCAPGIFQRSAVLSRRTSALLHLAICLSRIRWRKGNHTSRGGNNKQFSPLSVEKYRFKLLWRRYKLRKYGMRDTKSDCFERLNSGRRQVIHRALGHPRKAAYKRRLICSGVALQSILLRFLDRVRKR